MRETLCLVAALLALVNPAFAQTLPRGVQQRASLGGITEYAFPNGLRVLLFPDPSNPKVTVNMTYLVGSRFEGYGETGMAHLLEHLNYIRSTHDREIKKELTDHGAQWNGSTDFDRTNYFETVTASDENLRWALGLEAERMVNMRMEKALLDTEMTVVRNEFERGENNVQRVLEERVLATAFLWHNYGKAVIGSRVDLERVPIDRLAAFYRKYYQPDNAVLVIAGQFDASKALAMVSDTIGAIPRPARALDAPYTAEPAQDGERFVELRRVGSTPVVMAAWHGPALAHQDAAALEVLAGVMVSGGGGGRGGGGGTGRLYKALVDGRKALTVRMGVEELHDPGFVTAIATLGADQSLDEARKVMMDTIAAVAADPPTIDEVARARTRILQGMETRMANSQQAALGLSETIASGDWRLYFVNYDQVKAVTPADFVRVARLYFKPSNRTVGYFIPTPDPDRTDVPAPVDLDALLTNYKTGLSVSSGEAFDSSPANVEKRLVRATLQNGMKVAMLPKATRGDAVTATIQLRFGDEKSLVRHARDRRDDRRSAGTRHLDAHAPGAAGRDAQAECPHHRHGRRGTRLGHHRHHRSEPGAGHPARRRNAARARVPGGGIRSGEEAAPGRHREQPDRAGRARAARAHPRPESVPARRRPVRGHHRRADRRPDPRDAGRRAEVSRAVLWRLARRARRRRTVPGSRRAGRGRGAARRLVGRRRRTRRSPRPTRRCRP